MTSRTDVCLTIDSPKSSVKAFTKNVPSCSSGGSSSPRSSSMRATLSGVALMPSMSVTGSPGISRMTRNETTNTPIRTGML